MDKTAGIIAEYNPFHNGHSWQIAKIRESLGQAPLIALMSGHFTQRGEAAFADKWLRAAMAVRGGIDLVLELPFVRACKSAEFFARGGIETLNALKIIDYVCFGAECADLGVLRAAAAALDTESAAACIKKALKEGVTYARAVETALKNLYPAVTEAIHRPNSILAVEYIRALNRTASSIQPLALERRPDASNGAATGAAALRRSLRAENIWTEDLLRPVPASTAELLKSGRETGRLLLDENLLNKIALYRLRQLDAAQIRKISDSSEGLENRVKKAALRSSSLAECLARISSVRYPKTRAARIVSQLLVLKDAADKTARADYLRVLAFNTRGRELIKKIKCRAEFPVITNLPAFYKKNLAEAVRRSLDADVAATDIFTLLCGRAEAGLDFFTPPVYVE
jgi:predicted nucleotidyltransferase